MRAKRFEDADLERLLRDALPDDLPDEAAAGMRDRIAAFRTAAAKEERGPAVSFILARKGAWAVLALALLIAGALLQGFQSPSPLAKKSRSSKTSYRIRSPPVRPISTGESGSPA
jgi:hypothetical protein